MQGQPELDKASQVIWQQFQYIPPLVPGLRRVRQLLYPLPQPLGPAVLAQVMGEKQKKKRGAGFNPTTTNSQLLLIAFALHILSQPLSEPQSP